MRLNVVRLLKLFLALLFVTCLISLFSFAQSAQPSQPEAQQPAKAQPSAEEQAPASSPTATPQPASDKDRPFKIKIVPQKPQQKPLKTLDDRFLIKDAQGIPLGMREQIEKARQKAMQEFMETQHFQPYRLLTGQSSGESGNFDRGIYARQADGANVCGSIVSYNFSPGANPRLENVTTCTPTSAVTSKRAGVPDKKPEGPRVLQAVDRQEEKK